MWMGGRMMSIDEIISQLGINTYVVLSGAEPLEQDIVPLILRLNRAGKKVVLETSLYDNITEEIERLCTYIHVDLKSFVGNTRNPTHSARFKYSYGIVATEEAVNVRWISNIVHKYGIYSKYMVKGGNFLEKDTIRMYLEWFKAIPMDVVEFESRI